MSACCKAANVSAYLDLQSLIAADAFVVHFMISIVSIAAALVLDKGKSDRVSGPVVNVSKEEAYSRLERVRGAGMSQRTRRP